MPKRTPPARPDWDQLYATAAAQQGCFHVRQASDAGFSPQLLAHHLRERRIVRLMRAVYRLVQYPPGEHEDLVALWLWTQRAAVFSHETALALHELGDALPSVPTMTLPSAWRRRRLRYPVDLVTEFDAVSKSERTWIDGVPATTPLRTLSDCARHGSAPDLVRSAIADARARGLISGSDAERVARALVTGHQT